MPNQSNTLPEGTDSIIAGASATAADDFDQLPVNDGFTAAVPFQTTGDTGGGDLKSAASSAVGSLREQAVDKASDLRGQAGDKARSLAEQGKDRATAALEGVSRLIDDTAVQVDEKVGREYGDYARRAADAVDGLAATLRDKDVDTLFADARELVRKSPAMAISAAAVLGFALVRLVKSGAAAGETAARSDAANTNGNPGA